jgi:hypothetical protein
VFQTEGEPPSKGRIIFANIGSTTKRRAEFTSEVIVNKNSKKATPLSSLPHRNAVKPKIADWV